MSNADLMKDFSLKGKAAVVVGADTSVGSAAASALEQAGARVMPQNSVSRSELRDGFEKAAKQLGSLDIVVNAIDAPFYAPVEKTDDAAFDSILQKNLKPVWLSCQEAGRVMIPRGGGVIVNVTSVMAERGVPNAALYCAAKAAVLNLTRALAIEWARKGIRVNALEAGWLDEPSSPTVNDKEFRGTLLKYLPYNRLVKPEELGGALLYLVSPAAGFVTGESIAVDGGLLCRV
jgi:2-deoxy-D-gluconate 3-dehydrogenase